jgi:transposase InsO family protein/transposase-like protein
MIRPTAGEKLEIIRLVEESQLTVRQTLVELDIPSSTFYRWYQRYQDEGLAGLQEGLTAPRRFWNRIPESVRDRVVHLALAYPDKSPRELACFITDHEEYFLSESSVYRILKGFDLVTSPAFKVVSASDHFKNPTKRVNEMWQTDFTQFRLPGWGWYYLSTVLDDYSRYILAWKLSPTMDHTDVEDVLKQALERTGVSQVKVAHRPRLLSDNGPAYLSKDLKDFLAERDMHHIHGAPFHPQTQGKIERWHRSLKNVVNLDVFYFPWDLEAAIAAFVDEYNNRRYHESLNNMTPADVFFGRAPAIQTRREEIKLKTLHQRREQNLLLTVSLA